ncbi:acyl-CoA thioesterase [Actimicrobium sp. GrIS 1.19]|uniref:PaaI family thioesterase n=1 Tax=Actimicrobium sp. GrIS 1.19 TaxID=3071708 RepID=UPI002E04EAC0|nr:acyl-CoA thioesterase [Actimicrobium sp. GrIS 1.19]
MIDSRPQPFPSEIPFLDDLGVEFLGMADGQAQVALTLTARHMNGWQVGHGGVTMTLLDVAMAMAGRSLEPTARGGVTIDMTTSFLQPAGQPGGRLIATGRACHRSTTLVFCEAEVRNGERVVAKAMGTFKFIKRLDVAQKFGSLNGDNNEHI